MPTVVLADDHALVRAGLRRIIEATGYSVVGEAGDGLRVLAVVEETKPQVLVLDLGLPGLHGLDVIRDVTRRMPSTRVLVVTAHDRDDFVVAAFRNGAAGYVLKGCETEELLAALGQVARGGYYVSTQVSSALAKGLGDEARSKAGDPYDSLTSRERQVFHLIAEGQSNAQAGERLFISARTAETHRANVMRKLGLATQTDVVLYAMRRGILGLDDPGGIAPIVH